MCWGESGVCQSMVPLSPPRVCVCGVGGGGRSVIRGGFWLILGLKGHWR